MVCGEIRATTVTRGFETMQPVSCTLMQLPHAPATAGHSSEKFCEQRGIKRGHGDEETTRLNGVNDQKTAINGFRRR